LKTETDGAEVMYVSALHSDKVCVEFLHGVKL